MGMIVNSKMLQIKVDNIAMKRTIFLSNEEKRLMSNHGNEEKRKNRDYFQQTKKTKIFEPY
jgi:hypothetical protein